MLPEIKFFIDSYCIEDNKSIVETSFDLLDELEITDYINDYNDLFMVESDIEVTELLPTFMSIINKQITELLTLHGIITNEEATLDCKNKILEGILMLPDYSDKLALLVILESQDDEMEKFCELLSHVSTLQSSDLFNKVDSVDTSLFTKLLSIVNASNSDNNTHEDEKNDLKVEIIKKLKSIKKVIGYDNAVGFTLVNNSIVLGASFDQYCNYAIKHFDTYTPDVVAKELFVLLTLSEEGFHNPLIVFRKYSQDLFSDLDRITKIDIELNKLIMQFDKSLLIQTTVV